MEQLLRTRPHPLDFSTECDGCSFVQDVAGWTTIRDRNLALVVQKRWQGWLAVEADRMLDLAPFERNGVGSVAQACAELGPLPSLLAEDIAQLAGQFADLMSVESIRIRLELVTGNSCRKIHADYTDLRLITTYAGPATQVLPLGEEPEPDRLWSMQPGWVGLFKGRLFGEEHPVCLHRSPPAGDLGEKRLVLVVDTSSFGSQAGCS